MKVRLQIPLPCFLLEMRELEGNNHSPVSSQPNVISSLLPGSDGSSVGAIPGQML